MVLNQSSQAQQRLLAPLCIFAPIAYSRQALRGSPSTFSHCLTTNLLTVLRINSVSVILCRKVPSGFLILCHDYAINEAVNLPCTGSQPVNVTINSGHQPALTPALSEHLAGLLPSGALRLSLRRLGPTDATAARTRNTQRKTWKQNGPCDTSSALKTGPSGNCRRFLIRRQASGPIPSGPCSRAGPSHCCS